MTSNTSIYSLLSPAAKRLLGIAKAGPRPIISGGTPTTECERILPIIFMLSLLASALVIRRQALAPSETWEEFPPVDFPSLLKEGFSLAKASKVVSYLIPSSVSTSKDFFSFLILVNSTQIG